jgi:hypothetical protein
MNSESDTPVRHILARLKHDIARYDNHRDTVLLDCVGHRGLEGRDASAPESKPIDSNSCSP